jgi:hypothetical protein
MSLWMEQESIAPPGWRPGAHRRRAVVAQPHQGAKWRWAGIVAACALAAFVVWRLSRPEAPVRPAQPVITPALRAQGLRFAPGVSAADQAWVLAAVAKARPEAARLIDEVDGLVTVKGYSEPDSWFLGFAGPRGAGPYAVRLNLGRLDAERRFDRDTVVLHELGHIVDYALVRDRLRDRMAAQLPATGVCAGQMGDCASPEERFADTFAKWALRGAVSLTGAGYGLNAPASLEDWGAPLARLAVRLDARAPRPQDA